MNASRPTPLTVERFRALLEAYGSRLARWPEAERAGAEALLTAAPEAARWLADHQDLDAWLDAAQAVEPSTALMRRIAEIPLRHPRRSGWARLSVRNAGAALSAAAALGVLTGVVTPDRWLDDADTDSRTDDEYALTWSADLGDEVDP